MAKSLGQSDRRKPASLAAGCFKAQATSAAPAYSKAAVGKVPTPLPKLCTMGVLNPNRAAASKASEPPLNAGWVDPWFIVY
jgi:hypothetical protein